MFFRNFAPVMAQELRYTQEQQQKLTQEQQQRLNMQQVMMMRLLEMPITQLEQNVQTELDENPALEVERVDDDDVNGNGDEDDAARDELDEVLIACYTGTFSEHRAMALVCKLEKYMMQLVQIMHKVIELTELVRTKKNQTPSL